VSKLPVVEELEVAFLWTCFPQPSQMEAGGRRDSNRRRFQPVTFPLDWPVLNCGLGFDDPVHGLAEMNLHLAAVPDPDR
jgi:hypothetical protein